MAVRGTQPCPPFPQMRRPRIGLLMLLAYLGGQVPWLQVTQVGALHDRQARVAADAVQHLTIPHIHTKHLQRQ